MSDLASGIWTFIENILSCVELLQLPIQYLGSWRKQVCPLSQLCGIIAVMHMGSYMWLIHMGISNINTATHFGDLHSKSQ